MMEQETGDTTAEDNEDTNDLQEGDEINEDLDYDYQPEDEEEEEE